MDQAVRTMVHEAGATLTQAAQMASLNAARVLKMKHCRGILAVGKNADIVLGTVSIKGGSLGISGATLGVPTTTATLPFRVVGLWSDYAPAGSPGTDNTTPYNLAVVTPNTAQMTGI
jgi:hypothetical protein